VLRLTAHRRKIHQMQRSSKKVCVSAVVYASNRGLRWSRVTQTSTGCRRCYATLLHWVHIRRTVQCMLRHAAVMFSGRSPRCTDATGHHPTLVLTCKLLPTGSATCAATISSSRLVTGTASQHGDDIP
jgi:hypothetical protein